MGPSSRCCLNTQNKAASISYVFAGCLPRLCDIRMEMCPKHKPASAGRARLTGGGGGLMNPQSQENMQKWRICVPGWWCGQLNETQNANVSPDQPRVSYLHLKLFVADFPCKRFVLEFLKLNQKHVNGPVVFLLRVFWKAPTLMHTRTQTHLLVQEVCPLAIQISAIYIPKHGGVCVFISLLNSTMKHKSTFLNVIF